jgi:hypothetical protein
LLVSIISQKWHGRENRYRQHPNPKRVFVQLLQTRLSSHTLYKFKEQHLHIIRQIFE